jgi:hypothetical protein
MITFIYTFKFVGGYENKMVRRKRGGNLRVGIKNGTHSIKSLFMMNVIRVILNPYNSPPCDFLL